LVDLSLIRPSLDAARVAERVRNLLTGLPQAETPATPDLKDAADAP
jgi:hypothetical protein